MISGEDAQQSALRPLRALVRVGDGAPAHYRSLSNDTDEFIRVGAWLQLLTLGTVDEPDWPTLLQLCRHASIRGLATDYFLSIYEHTAAKQAAETPAEEHEEIRRAGLRAKLSFDDRGTLRYCERMFFATGRTKFLVDAAIAAEAIGGWAAALPWLVRQLLLSPTFPGAAAVIMQQVLQSDDPALMEDFLEILAQSNLHTELAPLGWASLASGRGDAAACIDLLAPLTDEAVRAQPALKLLFQAIKTLRAESFEKVGAFGKAHAEYAELNAQSRSRDLNPHLYFDAVDARSKHAAPPLPADPRSDVVQMLGFPRSGTTLLENALNAHPRVETFEEIPAHLATVSYLERALGRHTFVGRSKADVYVEARRRYYVELDMRRRKPEATVLVDKLPIQTADAKFMSALFPDRRYIFSVRHPYDVVLSCFRQQFAPGVMVENFQTIPDAVKFYDFTMIQWFDVFSMESPNVSYVRYEDLVEDFETTMRRICAFLELPWDASVLEFSELSRNRSFKTPSYRKVRKGLSIGVQTYWRNYGFLFQTPEAKPLHKWAEFFGYPTS